MEVQKPWAGVAGAPLFALARSHPNALFFLTTFVYSWVIYLRWPFAKCAASGFRLALSAR